MTDVMSVLFPSSPRPPVAADAATGEPDNAESPRQSPSRVPPAGSSGGETGPGHLPSSPHRVPEAVEAAELEDGSSWEGGSTENLTVSVQVVSVTNSRPTGGGVGLGTPESDRGGVGLGTPESDQVEAAELGTPPTVLELPVANPIRAQTEADTHATRRPGLVQITLAASFHPPTPPAQQQLPNLALAALQRLAENGTHGDDSLDDFRPLKKRKLAPETDDTCEEDSEVSEQLLPRVHSSSTDLPVSAALCSSTPVTMQCCVLSPSGADVLDLLRAVVQFRRSQDCLPQVWPSLWTEVSVCTHYTIPRIYILYNYT